MSDHNLEPDEIVPIETPKRTIKDRAAGLVKAFTTKSGLIGDYDYAFLFRPNIPFMKKDRRVSPFFGLNERMPLLLGLLLGFQHALAMLAGVVSPPIILAGSSGANFSPDVQRYLVSTSLIVCGILSAVQITRFHIWKTPYVPYTSLTHFMVGTSFAIIPIAQGAFAQMYANGKCPLAADGTKLPCPEGYGALLGTSVLCALLEIGLSFLPPKLLKKIFPPIVTGPTVLLIGVKLIATGFKNWAGGSGLCASRPADGIFAMCPTINAPHPLPWGSAEFIGLGFSVFVTIILCERFGSPIMKSCAVIIGLFVGCVIAAGTGYFDDTDIKAAPVASFIWVHTFPLTVYPPLILPIMAVYVILACEAIGDITATCEVSRLEVEGKMFDSRIQGGVLADGLNGLLAGLCTNTPMSTFAQNNGVIALTRCANRKVNREIFKFRGIFSKFAAALVSIPSSVLGGMTTFLFTSVAVSGMRIISTMPFTRRNRFILTAALALGYGATLVPNWFDYFFTYAGGNKALQGLLDAISLIMETGFAVTAFAAMILHGLLVEEAESEDLVDTPEAPEYSAGEEAPSVEADHEKKG
ncbi:permease family-domain-containing protein [Peziza echinospora]|nr:permease family-domain-containing protein [Peziza echinospora]